ncbi:hypothetical protein [Nocardia xishanensis]|uniref:hypothetical protein n=1 Tax=Nocardia xishanensis TaxID=238964 RepID=UPI003419D4A7
MTIENHDCALDAAKGEPDIPDVAFSLTAEFGIGTATVATTPTHPTVSAISATTAVSAMAAAPEPPAASASTPAPEFAAPAAANDHAAEDRAAEMRGSAEELVTAITDLLLPTAPPDWQQLRVGFSVTVAAVSGDAVFLVDGKPLPAEIPMAAVELVQALRMVTVRPDGSAWWHVTVVRDRTGTPRCEFGYGDVAFPVERLLPTAAYRADLEHFSRERLPVWLAGRLRVEDDAQQLPRVLARARLDRAPATPVPFLTAPTVWARWATVAAAAVAIGTEWGPRILGSTAAFEGTDGSGSTLHLLPRGRAVLSGGLWNAPELAAAYNDGAPVPEYYAGVPDWLDGAALNHRAFTAQLSFCYWWDGTGWSSGQSPAPTTIGAAIPGLWTPATVVDIVCGVLGASASRPAVADLVAAAESGSVTREQASAAFTTDEDTDVPGAWSQLAVAGLTR